MAMKRAYVRPSGAINVGHYGSVVDLVKVKGSDKRLDAMKPAMKAGMRRTANPHQYHGRTIRKQTTYYENRENRADKNGTKKPYGKGVKNKKLQ